MAHMPSHPCHEIGAHPPCRHASPGIQLGDSPTCVAKGLSRLQQGIPGFAVLRTTRRAAGDSDSGRNSVVKTMATAMHPSASHAAVSGLSRPPAIGPAQDQSMCQGCCKVLGHPKG